MNELPYHEPGVGDWHTVDGLIDHLEKLRAKYSGDLMVLFTVSWGTDSDGKPYTKERFTPPPAVFRTSSPAGHSGGKRGGA